MYKPADEMQTEIKSTRLFHVCIIEIKASQEIWVVGQKIDLLQYPFH